MIELKALCFGFLKGLETVIIPPIQNLKSAERVPLILDYLPSISQIDTVVNTRDYKIIFLPEISPYSHLAAFLWYREVNVVSVDFDWKLYAGSSIYLDFESETIHIPESKLERERLQLKVNKGLKLSAFEQKSRQQKKGSPIKILAEVSSHSDLAKGIESGADGFGVIKYEDIFISNGEMGEVQLLDSHDLPERLLIRFFDLGSEKFTSQKTTNYLGNRGIRITELDETVIPEFLFKLMPLDRKQIVIILPMVTSAKEVLSFKEKIRGKSNYKLGITLETPAAALMIEDFKGIVDFIEIGLNDLTQYTMAWDRDMPNTVRLPADEIVQPVAKLIKDVVAYCKANEIEYTLGLDLRPSAKLAKQLWELGVLSISCSPSLIKPWQENLAKLDLG